MDTSSKKINWHYETLPRKTRKALDFLSKEKWLRKSKWYLAGGTALAVSQRGRKRDFFDLFWCAQNIEPLEEIIKRLPAQYPSVAHDYHHILKSLIYFADAESDPGPEIYFKASWNMVKRFFRKEIPIITRKIMKLK
ncbi:MAG: hypothetical protein Q8O46_01390 [bacterium]|nr:hypothetical protein [bacterium]